MAGRAGGSVFLLTDYGLADEFAGVVRASVVRYAPGVPIIDLTHGVTPFDVRAGALALVRAVAHLGPGVVMAVVDPGVGTRRRAVAVSVASTAHGEGPHHFVGPDNGLLPWAIDLVGGADRAVEIRRDPAPDSAGAWRATTFDGRDLFAPAAARLWQGVSMQELGPALDPADLVRLTEPRVSTGPGSLEAEVLWVDGFGNVQLAARPADAVAATLDTGLEVIGAVLHRARRAHRARRVHAFADITPGELGLIVDANGYLAVVCDRQSAATVLGVQPGDLVMLRAVDRGDASP